MKRIVQHYLVAFVCLLLSLAAYGQARVTVGTMKNSAVFGGDEDLVISIKDGAVNVVGDGQSYTYASMPMTENAVMKLDFTRKNYNSQTDDKLVVTPSVQREVANEKEYYTTLYAPYNLVVPNSGSCSVYVPEFSGNTILVGTQQLLSPGTIIPIGTGLIVKSDNDTEGIEFPVSKDAPNNVKASALSGTSVITPVYHFAPKGIYALSNVGGKLGFNHFIANHTAACKAFLKTEYLLFDSKAKQISIIFEDDIPTAISSVGDEGDGQTYNTLGQKVSRYTPGIVIRNGKKYINR